MNESNPLARWRAWAPYLLSVLRIVAALLFMQPGAAKLFAFPAAIMPGGGTVRIASLLGVAGILAQLPRALPCWGCFELRSRKLGVEEL